MVQIDYRAFGGCSSLINIKIPDSVTTISDNVFGDCTSLTNIAISNNIIRIGQYAFNNTAYYNESNNWKNDVLYIDKCLIEARKNISGSYVIKDTTICIASSAFSQCTGLTSVEFPNSMISIDTAAFYECTGLTSIEIPNSVTSIGGGAFADCTNLTNIALSNSIVSISNSVFDNTAYYNESNNWENDVLYVGKCLIRARENISGTYSINEGTMCLAQSAFSNCTELTNIEIPNSVTSICAGAFLSCTGLTTIEIPKSVETVEVYAFGGLLAGSIIYCENQAVADLLVGGTYSTEPGTNYTAANTTVVVDASKFE